MDMCTWGRGNGEYNEYIHVNPGRLGLTCIYLDMSLSKLRETVKDRESRCAAFMGSQRAGHDLVTEQQIYMSLALQADFLPSEPPGSESRSIMSDSL